MDNKFPIFINVSTRSKRVSHITKPRPIINIYTRLTSKKKKDTCRTSITVNNLCRRVMSISAMRNFRFRLTTKYRNSTFKLNRTINCYLRMFKERVVNTIQIIINFRLFICMIYRIRCPISMNSNRSLTKGLLFTKRDPRAINRMIIFRQTILLCNTVTTIIINRCRTFNESSFTNATATRVRRNVLRNGTIKVMSLINKSRRSRFHRNCFILLLRINRRPRAFINIYNGSEEYGRW